MKKGPIRVLFLAVTLMFALEPLQSVHGILLSRLERITVSAPETPETPKQNGKSNGFLSALKAPFKALGRLFGGGKKDENKLQRITAKDIKKFESAPANRVDNTVPSRGPSQPAPTNNLTPSSAGSHLDTGRALLDAGNLNAAISELSTAASLDPKLSEAHTLLGVAYDRKGLSDRAQDSFTTALHSPDDEAMHLNNLGYLEYKNGDYEQAVKYLKRAAKLAPTDQRIWNNLGLAQSELGKFDDAYKSFARVAGEFNGHLNTATRLENHAEPEKAIKHLEKALALQPTSALVLTRLAGLYDRVGKPERAEQARNTLKASLVTGTLAEKK